MATRTRTRKFFIVSGSLLLLLFLIIALLPAMISAGLLNGTIRGSLSANVKGEIDFQSLRLTWFGPQEVRGLSVTDETGAQALVADLSASPSLFSFIFGGPSLIEATISGVVRGDLYPDGSTSFERLVDDRPKPAPKPSEPVKPFSLAGVPSVALRVAGIEAHLRDVAGGQNIVVSDLQGDVTYVPGDRVQFELRADTLGRVKGREGATDHELRGTIVFSGESKGLFGPKGEFTPRGAPMTARLAVANIPIPGLDVNASLTQLHFVAQTDSLTDHIAIDLRGGAQVQDEAPSVFMGEARISLPFREDGSLNFSPDRITGILSGQRVPSSLLQPFMPAAVVLSRDAGPTVDLDVELPGGIEGAAIVRVTGARAQLEVSAQQRDAWWVGDRLSLRTERAHPELVAGLTGLTIDEPTDVSIELSSFALPPVDERKDARPLSQYGLTGVLQVGGPAQLVFDADDAAAPPRRVTLNNAVVTLASDSLGKQLSLNGTALIDSAPARFNYTITRLFNDADEMDVMNAAIVGELNVTNLPLTTVTPWMPEQADLATDLLGDRASITLTTSETSEGLAAQLAFGAPRATASVAAVRGVDALTITTGEINATVSPALFARFAPQSETPMALVSPARATIAIQPLRIPGKTFAEYDFLASPINAAITVDEMAMRNVPGFEETVGVRTFRANVAAMLGEAARYTATGDASLIRPGTRPAPREIAALTFDVLATAAGEGFDISGKAGLTRLSVSDAETAMGREPGSLSQWTGDGGALNTQFTMIGGDITATLASELPRLRGTFNGAMKDDIITVKTSSAEITLAADTLQQFLEQDDPSMRITVPRDVALRLDADIRAPLTMLTGEPIAPAHVALINTRATLTGQAVPVVINNESSTLRNLKLDLRSETTNRGVDFIVSLTSGIEHRPRPASGGAAQATVPGTINVQGTVRETVKPNEALATERATIDLDATLSRTPTPLLDALISMRGYLTAAVGEEVSATINARNFSKTSGTIALDVTSPNGKLNARGEGRDGALIIKEGQPITAELQITPLMRDRILKPLNPMLGDLVSAERPIRVSFARATLPLEGGVKRLSGDVSLDIGKVNFRPLSPFASVLQLSQGRGTANFTGSVDPVSVSIRQGVVKYDRFLVHLDRVAFPFAGEINLDTRQVRLQSPLPLGEVIHTFGGNLPAAVRAVEVPLVTTGTIDNVKVTADFSDKQFLSRMAEAGFRDRVGDLLPKEIRDLRDLFPPRP